MRVRLTLLTVAFGLLFGAGTAQGQSISGTLTDAVTGLPLGNFLKPVYGIQVVDVNGQYVSQVFTLQNGAYHVDVPAGTYFVWAFGLGNYYVPELYNNLPCVAADCVYTAGTPVVVSSGTTVVDIALDRSGGFSGTVRQTGGSPLVNARVRVYNAGGSLVHAAVFTQGGGIYGVDGLAPGTYYARTEAVTFDAFGSPNVIDELYGGLPCPAVSPDAPECRVTDGTPITVTAEATTPGIDFSLETGGGISGFVRNATGQGIDGARVTVYAGDRVVGVDDTSFGEYIINGLPSGTYAVEVTHASGTYRREWYDDKCVTCGDRPTPVTVTAGSTTTGINVELSPAGAIEGTLRYTTTEEFPLLLPPQILVYDSAGRLVTSVAPQPVAGLAYVVPYRIAGLPSGTYYVKAWDRASVAIISSPGIPRPPLPPANGMLVGELYNSITCVAADCRPTSGTPVVVTAGSTTTGIDFALEVGGTVAGIGIDEKVEVFDARGVQLPQRAQFTPGNRVTGLPAGTYYLRKPRGLGAAETYRGVVCADCPATFGTPIVVRSGQHVTGIDFSYPVGRAITGTVRDASLLTPLSDVTVEAYTADGRLMGAAPSSFGGVYRIGQLNPGSYYLRSVNNRGYADEIYDNVACSQCSATRGTPVVVSAGADTTGVDFSLAPATTVGGVVTAADGFWLPGTPVSIFDAAGALAAKTTASALGRFTTSLAPGSYRARTDERHGYVQELFDNLPCAQGACDVAAGTSIALASAPVTNVNFSLATCAAPSISPLRLASGAIGVSYRQTLGAAGGTPPRQFHVASGALPAGLSLNGSSGVLAGTPTTSGSFPLTIGVGDATGCGGTRDYVLDVAPCRFNVWGGPTTLRARGEPGLLWITDTCGPWTVTADSWIRIDPSQVGVAFVAMPNPGPGPRTGTIVVGPRAITINQSAPVATPPFGFLDAPLDGTVVEGSVAIGGWALDDLGVYQVRLYRNSVSPEPLGERVFLGTAVFVEGARPDIEVLYPNAFNVRRAGWGFMLLTNMLPQQGNGVFQISAYAVDSDLTEAFLGVRTIVANNATATTPFGAIDTPRQGETVSGAAYVNFGWALTPQPKSIPTDGSTFRVYVDGVPLGTVNYNFFREDIAALFPGYANSNGAVGFRLLDTTALDDGLHTIAWTVIDSLGAAAGIGSRYFTVSNSVTGNAPPFPVGVSAAMRGQLGRRATAPPLRVDGVDVGRRVESLDLLPLGDGEARLLTLSPLDRLELSLEHDGDAGCSASWSGYHVVAGETRPLPTGSALDPAGSFYWQPGPAFGGTYELVFVRTACDGGRSRVPVRVNIRPADVR